MNWRDWFPPRPLPVWQSLLVGLGCGVVAAGARWILPSSVGLDAPFVVYFPFVALATAYGGVTGGGVVIVIASLVAMSWRAHLVPTYSGPLAVFWAAGALVVVLLTATRQVIWELRLSEESLGAARDQVQTIANELAHRNRNSLSVMMSIVDQSARGATSAADAAQVINSRIEALVRAQELLLESGTGTIELRPLIERALTPFDVDRFEISGLENVQLASDVGIGLGLVFHELATNAIKHGALTAPPGSVVIDWKRMGATVHLTWRERGGPPATQPIRRGFGSRLFGVALVTQGGKAECRFEPEGVTCELAIPAPANPPRFLSPIPARDAWSRPALGQKLDG